MSKLREYLASNIKKYRKEKKITQVLNAKVEEKTTEDSKESENDEQKDSN